MLRALGMVAALALVVAGCSEPAERGAPPRGPETAGQASRPLAGGTRLAAPRGTRWVGMHDVVVAVPREWGTATQACEPPDGDTVAFRGTDSLTMDCADYPTRGVSSVSIAAARTGAIPLGRRVDLSMVVDGVRLTHSGLACSKKGSCETTFLVNGSGVVFRAVGQGRDGDVLVESIRDSVTRLPDGLSTVPFIEHGRSLEEAQEQLAGAGLTAEVPDVDFPYYVVGTVPPAGSVVEEGTEVGLEIGDG